jgi:hypothetical protein
LHQYSFTKKSQSQTVSREKLRKTLSFKKAACKIVVTLTPGVNFINILLEPFCAKFWHQKITKLCLGFEIFLGQNFVQKRTQKLRMKLMAGL